LTGHVGSRNGNLALRGMEGVRRFVETGAKVGQRSDVVDGRIASAHGEASPAEAEKAELLREEQELTARLEAIRERRGGG
jgi:hypothetical protein